MKIIHIIVQNNTYYSERSRWTKQQDKKSLFSCLLLILSQFLSFLLIFLGILLIIFTIFLGYQNPEPDNNYKVYIRVYIVPMVTDVIKFLAVELVNIY